MWTTQKRGGAAVLVLLLALWGCPGDRAEEETMPAAEAAQLTPEQQMQTALQRMVDAQARHFQDHDRYADSLHVLVDDYDFQPVGEAQVTLSFVGTEPQWGYVAEAIHPFSNQRCEVLHGRATDGREFAGRIACEGPAEGPPQPTQAPLPGEPMAPATEPQPAAPGVGADQPRVTPRTEIDTVPQRERQP